MNVLHFIAFINARRAYAQGVYSIHSVYLCVCVCIKRLIIADFNSNLYNKVILPALPSLVFL